MTLTYEVLGLSQKVIKTTIQCRQDRFSHGSVGISNADGEQCLNDGADSSGGVSSSRDECERCIAVRAADQLGTRDSCLLADLTATREMVSE